MILWLAEKPATAEALARALGVRRRHPGWTETNRGAVAALSGHVVRPRMPGDSWSTEPILPDHLDLEVDPAKANVWRAVRPLIERASRVVVATDVGREGEAIGHQALDHAGYRGPRDRCLLKNLEPSAVREAVAGVVPAETTMPRLLEALERQYHDYTIGLTGTRAANVALNPARRRDTWHVGPVKSPVVAMLVERERAIAAHVPRDVHSVAIEVEAGGKRLALVHEPRDERRFDPAYAAAVRQAVAGAEPILAVERRDESVLPPQPLSLDGFLARMGAAGVPLGAASTALQALYDKGHVTYPRTGAVTWPYAAMAAAPAVLAGLARLPEAPLAGAAAAAAAAPVLRRGLRYAQPKEHDALAPTRSIPNLASLSRTERLAYLVVARNYVANHLPDARDRVTALGASLAVPGIGPVEFRVVERRELAPGWRAAAGDERERPGSGIDLPDGTPARVAEARVETRQTKPPERYTPHGLVLAMARLIDQLDDPALRQALHNPDDPDRPKGLGTPATRKEIVQEIIAGGYAKAAGKNGSGPLTATAKAERYVDAHRRHPVLARFFDPVRRAELEHQLETIGSAPSLAQARDRAGRWRERVRAGVVELAGAYAEARTAGGRAESYAVEPRGKAPTADMVKFARDLARRTGTRLPKGYLQDHAVCKGFLEAALKARREEPPARAAATAPRVRKPADRGQGMG